MPTNFGTVGKKATARRSIAPLPASGYVALQTGARIHGREAGAGTTIVTIRQGGRINVL